MINRWEKLFFLWNELHGDGIDTMTGVFCGKPFSDEDMAKVSTTVVTNDLSPSSIRIGYAFNGTWDLVIKGRPSATGVELIIRAVEWGVTSSANVGARLKMFVIFTGKGALCPFV